MPGPEYTIQKGESKTVINAQSAKEVHAVNQQKDRDVLGFEFHVSGGEVRLSQSESRASNGRKYPDKFRGTIYPRGKKVIAHSPNTTITVTAVRESKDAEFKVRGQNSPEATIANTPDVDVTDRSAREIGKVRMEDDAGNLITSANPFPTEQQSPVGVEDSGGVQVNPREQADYASTYTAVDLTATGVTTIFNPANDAEVGGVFMEGDGGTADVVLQVTDGTDTAVLDDPGAGADVSFPEGVPVPSTDQLQIEVTATGSGSSTAVVLGGEL